MNQNITLSANNYTVPPVVHGVYKDTDRALVITFSDFTLASSDTAKLYVERPDGVLKNQSGTVNYSDNQVTVELDNALTQVGPNRCTLEITRSSNTVSSFPFITMCHENARYGSGGGTGPTGTINISENGDYDVVDYATAHVSVSGGVNPDAAFHVNVGDYLFYWVEYKTTFAFKTGMTLGEFTDSGLNPHLLDHTNVKVFSKLGNSIYYNIESGSATEAAYIGSADSLIEDNQVYSAEFGSMCLVAGTKIKTEKSAKNVENIKIGDTVTSLDPETLELTTATVGKVRSAYIPRKNLYSDKWFKYTFDDGSEFHITGGHRFFNMDTRKYEWAEDFKIGDRAYKIDGTTPRLVSVEEIDERVEYNTFWNVNREAYFVDGFLSGNASTPIPNFPEDK